MNTNPAGEPSSERRTDSARRRADAEAASERTRQARAEQARAEQARAEQAQAEQARAEPNREEQSAREERWEAQQAREPRVEATAGTTDALWQRWWEIQSSFVDDPRSSLAEAHALVSGAVDRVVHELQEQRNQLEQSWSNGREISTEDLRRGLQTYREFLGRLLSGTDPAKA